MKNDKRVYYYKDYTDELVENNNQNYKIPPKYKWINDSIFYNAVSYLVYGIFAVLGYLYCKIKLRVKIKNRKILKKYKKSGYFIYGNHTQVIGDVFIPALVTFNKRIYVIASPANLGIPIIGKILPMIGALPKPESISGMKCFSEAVRRRIRQRKCVVVYPEAHIWPYYTDIRPYPDKSFKFAVNESVPIFCMTTTYQKSKHSDKPKMTVYIDGPFWPDNTTTKDERIKKIHNDIYNCMKERSKESTYKYFEYERV